MNYDVVYNYYADRSGLNYGPLHPLSSHEVEYFESRLPVDVEVYTDWVLTRTNYAVDPNTTNLSMVSVGTGGTRAKIEGFALSPDAMEHTRTATGTMRIATRLADASYEQSALYSASVTVRASEDLTNVSLRIRPNVASGTNEVVLGNFDLVAGEITTLTGSAITAPTGTPSGSGLALVWSSGSIGSTLAMTDVIVEKAENTGALFSGATPNTPVSRTAWTGAATTSISTLETRLAYKPISWKEWATAFYRTFSGLPADSAIGDHVDSYYASLNDVPTAWRNELREDAYAVLGLNPPTLWALYPSATLYPSTSLYPGA
jgi:hypothetical protein